VLGLAVPIPFRTDRYYLLACRLLWRLSTARRGQDGYQTPAPGRPRRWRGRWPRPIPDRTFWLVGDSAYVNGRAVAGGGPRNLQVIGPPALEGGRCYDRARAAGPPEGRKGRAAEEGGPPPQTPRGV